MLTAAIASSDSNSSAQLLASLQQVGLVSSIQQWAVHPDKPPEVPGIIPDVVLLDLGRDPNLHLTFAFGKHFCLGNQLARLEGQIAIAALVRRFPSMRLAVGRDQLQYKPVQALRGFRSLPVTLR